MGLPRTINKQTLAAVLDCTSYKGVVRTRILKRDFFNDDIYNKLGITEKEFDKIKVFNYNQTQKIYELFDIESEEYEELFIKK